MQVQMVAGLVRGSRLRIFGKIGFVWVCFGFVLGLIGFELALNWVCFPAVRSIDYFHKSLLRVSLRSFEHLVNWVCFA